MGTRASAAGAVMALVVVPIGGVQGQAADPMVSIDRTGVAAGEEMLVTGSGWEPGATVIVELCGQGGLGGSADCDVYHQAVAGVGPGGTVSVALVAGKPPVPCPCVVKVSDQQTHVAATSALSVAGVPTVPITGDATGPTRSIEIDSMTISGRRSWTELFGAASPRTLTLEIVNTGEIPVARPSVSAAWGKGDSPTGFVEIPELTPMDPGESRTITAELQLGSLAFGEYTAVAEVQGLGETSLTTAGTTIYPWGLVALALVVLQLILLAIRNRVRARVHRRERFSSELSGFGDAVSALGATDEPPLAAEPLALAATPSNGARRHVQALDVPRPAVIDLTSIETNGYGHASSPVDAALEAHAPLDISPRDEIMMLKREARCAVSRAAELSESLIAASVARAQALEELALERERVTQERYAEACRLLEIASARADELGAAADAVSQLAKQDAAADREAAQQRLLDADSERRALLDAGRSAVDAVVADLERRADELAARLEDEIPSEVRDELDRRLATALTRALTETPGFERLRPD